jgi:hypothetical protein
MHRLFWKIAKDKLELVGRFNVGDTELSVAVDGNLVVGLVNGYRVVDGNLYENPIERIAPALASIAAKLFRDNWTDGSKIQICSKDWDSAGKYQSQNFLQAMLDNLSSFLDKDNVQVVGETPAATPAEAAAPQPPKVSIKLQALLGNLRGYQAQSKEVFKYAERTVERALVITRRKLPESMYGASDLQGTLDSLRSSAKTLSTLLEERESVIATGAQLAQCLAARLSSGINAEEYKYIKGVLIPGLQKSHDNLQYVVSSIVSGLARLNNIDKTIRTATGSPASFFLPTNVLEDFRDAYTVLVNFLADIPVIESGILAPLDYLRLSTSAAKAAAKN